MRHPGSWSELNRQKGLGGRASAQKMKVPPNVIKSEAPKQEGRDAHTWPRFRIT